MNYIRTCNNSDLAGYKTAPVGVGQILILALHEQSHMNKLFPYLEFHIETSNLQLLQYVKNMFSFESFYYIGIANILQ